VDETLTRRFHYNATIAKLDELINAMTAAARARPDSDAMRYAVHALPIVIAPFAPHIAEEMWHRLGHDASVHLEPYLRVEPAALAVDALTIVVQVNGKIRARLTVPPGTSEDDAYALALEEANVKAQLDGKQVRKRIFVPDKLLNLVVG